jgi:hypothetical protein
VCFRCKSPRPKQTKGEEGKGESEKGEKRKGESKSESSSPMGAERDGERDKELARDNERESGRERAGGLLRNGKDDLSTRYDVQGMAKAAGHLAAEDMSLLQEFVKKRLIDRYTFDKVSHNSRDIITVSIYRCREKMLADATQVWNGYFLVACGKLKQVYEGRLQFIRREVGDKSMDEFGRLVNAMKLGQVLNTLKMRLNGSLTLPSLSHFPGRNKRSTRSAASTRCPNVHAYHHRHWAAAGKGRGCREDHVICPKSRPYGSR